MASRFDLLCWYVPIISSAALLREFHIFNGWHYICVDSSAQPTF